VPELPEVETIRRDLQLLLPGKVLRDVHLLFPGFVKYPSPGDFIRLLRGLKVREAGRRGKYLILYLSRGFCLVVHLRMTGRLLYYPGPTPPAAHTRGVFFLSGGEELHFHDVRKFGTMWLVQEEDLHRVGGLAALGPEPLEEGFTPAFLHGCCLKTGRPLKSFLLSQEAAAGVGNIYADEALFLAGLPPQRRADSLSYPEAERLWQALRQALAEGIKSRGTSRRDYLDAAGRAGSYQDRLKVYGRRGEPCPRCGCGIERLRIAGRSSHYCPACQPREPKEPE
jgi:formamidopyrimidine-DNA glycosylase